MAHYVKCIVCGKSFNRDKEPFIEVSNRRYAHADCGGEVVQEARDKDAIYQYIKSKDSNYNYHLIEQQLKTIRAKNPEYTLTGILKSLQYFFDVEGNEWDTDKGIAIVPYVYQKAFDYYYNIYLVAEKNRNKIIPTSVQTIKINSPRTTVEPKRKWHWEE